MWNFQKRLELPNAFGTSKDFFMHVRWKSARVEKICEGGNFEIAVTVISRVEIIQLITLVPKLDRRSSVTAISKLLPSQIFPPSRDFHSSGTKKSLEVPKAFGTSKRFWNFHASGRQVAHPTAADHQSRLPLPLPFSRSSRSRDSAAQICKPQKHTRQGQKDGTQSGKGANGKRTFSIKSAPCRSSSFSHPSTLTRRCSCCWRMTCSCRTILCRATKLPEACSS